MECSDIPELLTLLEMYKNKKSQDDHKTHSIPYERGIWILGKYKKINWNGENLGPVYKGIRALGEWRIRTNQEVDILY